MDEESDADAVLDLLGDRTVRSILMAASLGQRSARAIAAEMDVAPSTVYRHVGDLTDANLLVERTKIEADGSHHGVYTTNVERVAVEFDSDGFHVRVHVSQTPSEQFARLWDDIREGT